MLQRSVGRSCSVVAATLRGPARCRTSQQHAARSRALPDIAATLQGPTRCRTLQQHAARSSALSAIAATLRGPMCCLPSQQRCDVQRVAAAAPKERYKLQCVDGQRRNNAASCNAPDHRYSSTRPTLDFRRTSIQLSSVQLPSDFRRTSVQLSSVELPSDVRPCVIVDVILLRPC
jgi:hypothetical protein